MIHRKYDVGNLIKFICSIICIDAEKEVLKRKEHFKNVLSLFLEKLK